MQEIIMYQMFNTENLTKRTDPLKSPEGGTPMIITPASWPTQALPDTMDPSKALSETDIRDKVHDLSELPVTNVKLDISVEERRMVVFRYLLECFGRVDSNSNQKVFRHLC